MTLEKINKFICAHEISISLGLYHEFGVMIDCHFFSDVNISASTFIWWDTFIVRSCPTIWTQIEVLKLKGLI